MREWTCYVCLYARQSFMFCTFALMLTGLLLPPYSTVHSKEMSSSDSPDAEQTHQLNDSSTVHDQARMLFEEGQYLKALPLAREALALHEAALEPTHLDVAAALTTLGLIHGTLVQLPQATVLLERALEIYRAAAEPNNLQVGEGLTNLATVMYASGDFLRAINILEQSFEIRERALGPSHADVGVTLSHLAIAQRGLSRLNEALDTAQRAVTILRAANPPQLRDLAMAVNVEGNILARLGIFEGARSSLEESLHLYEQDAGSDHPDFAGALAQLAMLERKQGNIRAALPLLKQALGIFEERYGDSNPEVAGILYEIGLAELVLGKVSDAEGRFTRSIAIQHATVGPSHPFVALSLIELAEVKRLKGNHTSARELLQRALSIQEQSLGPEHTSMAQTLTRLGYLEAQHNDLPSAKSRFARAVQIREQALGTSHRDGAASLLDLARVEHALGEFAAARSLYERARQILQAQQGLNPGLDDEALSRIWKLDMKGLQDYALLLATMAQDLSSSREQQSAVADGFMVTQQARGWLMQAAVANALAQQAVGSTGDRVLVKQVETLRRTRQELWTRLNRLYGLPKAQRSAIELAQVKHQLTEVKTALTQTNSQLNAEAPRYAELAQPKVLDLESAQRLLRANEALVTFSTLGDRVQIWLLRAQHPIFYRQVAIPQSKLKKLVQQIRASSGSADVPYDVESAAELFQLLFAPIQSSLMDVEHLILVPDEILLPLPFSALLTNSEGKKFSRLAELHSRQQRPEEKNLVDYANLPWLIKTYPLTILPSASALKLLRQNLATQPVNGEAFLGFGDPILRGSGQQRGGSMIAARGMRVAMDSLHALDSLPGTRAELLAVASILHVDPQHSVFLGQRANETEVRRLNDTGRLGQAKVLSFSTHGLLAGEVRGVTQPALVLTPPASPTDENDGLLSMEDILQLKLPNTEWVILSACNTAGDDGSGESLSGLARAFFFAGAKALLVSQWSVDDLATKELMSEIFKRYGGTPAMPQASSLREGMLALIEQGTTDPERAYFAHPYAWAAFSLVGDSAESIVPTVQ